MMNFMHELHNKIYQLPVFVFFFVLFSESAFYAHNNTIYTKISDPYGGVRQAPDPGPRFETTDGSHDSDTVSNPE
jgi:hypothetical protein